MPRPKSAKRPGSQPPTIHDVARRARVSAATVSKLLRGSQTVGRERAARINEAIDTLGYRRDPLAAGLRSRRRAIIGLVIPDFADASSGALVAAMERLAEADGYRLVTVSSAGPQGTGSLRAAALLDWRIAGLVVMPSMRDDEGTLWQRVGGLPLVVLGHAPPATPCDSVRIDAAAAAGEMARRFYAAGHRHLLVAATGLPQMAAAIAGITTAAGALPQPMQIEMLECGDDETTAAAAIGARLLAQPAPSAIFALTRHAALATLQQATRLNRPVPASLSLAGFEDSEGLRTFNPPVAAVIQPVQRLAETAWRQLALRLANPGDGQRTFELPCELEARGSIGRPP